MQPLALDLFCGAGGVCIGLQRAGFRVVGVDIVDQPDYPGDFVLGDALRPPVNLAAFDFVWASPPCQFASIIRRADSHTKVTNLIPDTRTLLDKHLLTVIENVPPTIDAGTLRRDLILTGSMFGRRLPRKRVFETSFSIEPPYFAPYTLPGGRCLVAAHGKGPADANQRDARLKAGLPPQESIEEISEALGVYHVISGTKTQRRHRLNQCIPPAYAEWIGRAAMRELGYPP